MRSRVLLFALLLLAAASAHAQLFDRTVAIVRLTETASIGRRELEAQLAVFQAQLGRQLFPAEKEQILDALVNDRLLLQAAARAGIRVTQSEVQNYVTLQRQQWSQLVGAALTEEQFRTQVESQTGSTWSEYLQDIGNELVKLKYVRQAKADFFARQTAPTEREINDFYEQQATSFTNPAMVSFRHAYIDLRGKPEAERQAARELLNGYRRQIQNGALTFDQLVQKSITDPAFSAADYGYLLRNDAQSIQLLGSRFVESVFALAVGEIGGVFESNVALHIVRITDRRPPRILGLDDPVMPGQSVTVRQQIRNLLAAQKEQEALAAAVEEVVRGLRVEAEITINRQNLPW